MEPGNRPYVDATTEPGDAGTEDWAEAPSGSGNRAERSRFAGPVAKPRDRGVVDGSPAAEFISNPDAIHRNVEDNGA